MQTRSVLSSHCSCWPSPIARSEDSGDAVFQKFSTTMIIDLAHLCLLVMMLKLESHDALITRQDGAGVAKRLTAATVALDRNRRRAAASIREKHYLLRCHIGTWLQGLPKNNRSGPRLRESLMPERGSAPATRVDQRPSPHPLRPTSRARSRNRAASCWPRPRAGRPADRTHAVAILCESSAAIALARTQ